MTWHDVLTWHEVRESDLKDCLEIEPGNLGDELVGRDQVLAIWKDLVRNRCFNSTVVEAPRSISPIPIVAFGASVFVTAKFVTAELHQLRPHLNSRLFASITSGNSVLLKEATLCEPSSEPLDLVILMGKSRDGVMTAEHAAQAQATLPFAFFEALVGYHLNRILMETTAESQRAFNMSSGVWRTIAVYPEGRNLMLMSPESALSVSGSVAAELYQYQPPVLNLRDTDKHLLSAAIHGETDSQLATQMNLSLASVKKRWVALFDRIAEVRPDLLPDSDTNDQIDVRGPQKRHRILAHVRSHPEELRPYRWRSFRHR